MDLKITITDLRDMEIDLADEVHSQVVDQVRDLVAEELDSYLSSSANVGGRLDKVQQLMAEFINGDIDSVIRDAMASKKFKDAVAKSMEKIVTEMFKRRAESLTRKFLDSAEMKALVESSMPGASW